LLWLATIQRWRLALHYLVAFAWMPARRLVLMYAADRDDEAKPVVEEEQLYSAMNEETELMMACLIVPVLSVSTGFA
jgi:hypothetical protein